MPNDVVLYQDDISVVNKDVVLVDQVANANVILLEPQVQITNEEFVISSGGMYGGNGLIGAVPEWLLSAVQQELTTGTGNITSVVLGMQNLLDSLQTGVTQTIASLNTLSQSTSSIITGLQSQVTNNKAEVLNVVATKVTSTEAEAIASNAISSTFGGNINTYIGNIASTYVDANSAIAQDIALVSSVTNSNSAQISTINGTITTLDSSIASQSTTLLAAIGSSESRIIQSYTVYVDANLSYNVDIYSSRGSIFRKLDAYTELSCRVSKGNVDITDSIPTPSFVWKRASNDVGNDIAWNTNHVPAKTLTITPDDVNGRADFTCIVTITI
jgi:hypothetical protein